MNDLFSINKYFVKYKWHFLGGIIFVTLSSFFGTYQGEVVRQGTQSILDDLTEKNPDVNTSIYLMHALKLIGFALISGVFMFLMRQAIIVMSRLIEFDQKNEIYNHYQKLDASFYKQNTTGDLMNRISEDVGKVRMYTGPAIMYITNTLVSTITVLVFMIKVNAPLTLFVFLPLPLLSFLIYKVSDKINKQSGLVQKELGLLTTQAQESFSAIRVIKAYAREKFFVNQMKSRGEVYKKTALKLNSIEALFQPLMMFMIGASVLITVWYGGKLVIDKKIEAANITEFIFYVFRLTWPFASLGWVTSLVQRAKASQIRINEFLKTQPNVVNTNTNEYAFKGDIKFTDVSFIYPENKIQALKSISFTLDSGKTLGITGAVASGKTSLLNVLTRQYDLNGGSIFIDGKNIKEHNLKVIRNHMAVVPQDVFLFSDTIYNNIAFGANRKIAREEIIEASKKAGVYENIMQFKDGFETMVGERGVTLSGGQKQRISIARALVGQPDILIFDDCLSAVDTETEEEILNYLTQEMKGKTCLIVSHRISSLKHADTILYLKEGEIIEQGTHQQLLEKRGAYFELNELQSA